MTKAEQARELEALRTRVSQLQAQLEAERAAHGAELSDLREQLEIAQAAHYERPAAPGALFTGDFAGCGAWLKAHPGKGRAVRRHGEVFGVFAR